MVDAGSCSARVRHVPTHTPALVPTHVFVVVANPSVTGNHGKQDQILLLVKIGKFTVFGVYPP